MMAELSTSALNFFCSSTVLTCLVCQFGELYFSGPVSQIITVWNDLEYSGLPSIGPNLRIPALLCVSLLLGAMLSSKTLCVSLQCLILL